MKTAGLLALLISVTAEAQFRSTFCETTEEPLNSTTNVHKLVGCGEGFPDNLLWHLDRANSVSGELDGKAFAPASGRGVVVYVMDFGIRRNHFEFVRAGGSTVIDGMRHGGLPSGGCADPIFTPCNFVTSHGSSVASVIGGATMGLAPDARLVAVVSGPSSYSEAFRAIAAHAFDPATPSFRTAIINISQINEFTGPEIVVMREELTRLTTGVDAQFNPDPNGKRFFIAVAAGNALEPTTHCARNGAVKRYPALLGPQIDGLVTVGAITRENEMWDKSCDGPAVELLAPGVDMFIASSTADDEYLIRSGTSFASPYVAGMAARILEREPALSPAEIEERLKASPSRVAGVPVPVMLPVPKRRAVR